MLAAAHATLCQALQACGYSVPSRESGGAHCHPSMGDGAMQAGGLGSTGKGRVMEVDPTEVHQRVPLFVGSKKEVEYLESFLGK